MKFNTLGYTSKDIGLQGNYRIIIAKNKAFIKYLSSILTNFPNLLLSLEAKKRRLVWI